MVLMLNEYENPFTSKEYRKLSECIPYLSEILEYDVSRIGSGEMHAILKRCPFIGSKLVPYKNREGLTKKARLYYIGTLKAFSMRPYQYDDEITQLGLAFERVTKIKLPWLNQPQTSHSKSYIQSNSKGGHGESFPDESNMEYCNQQLLNKYQFESKKTVRLTESQLKSIITRLTTM